MSAADESKIPSKKEEEEAPKLEKLPSPPESKHESIKAETESKDDGNSPTKIEVDPTDNDDNDAPPSLTSLAAPKKNSTKKTESVLSNVAKSNNLIVNYLPVTVTEEYLRELFSPYGRIAHCKVVKDKETQQNCGYGFVKYDEVSHAEAALNAMNSYSIGGKRLKVSFARPTNSGTKKANLYISGLPIFYKNEDILQLFSQFGPIVETRVLFDDQGQSRGIGFCRLENYNSALEAIKTLNGTVPTGGSSRITVKFAESNKQQRTNTYGAIRHQQMGGMPNRYAPMPNVSPRQPQGYTPYGQPPQQQPYAPYGGAASGGAAGYQQQYGMGGHPQMMPQAYPQQNPNYMGVCLFVFHVPVDCTEDTLFHLFSSYGSVVNTKIVRDNQTGTPKGYGFVNMSTYEEGALAISALNGYPIGGKRLKVSFKTQKERPAYHNQHHMMHQQGMPRPGGYGA